MRRVFLTGTIGIVIVGALAALLAVQAQDNSAGQRTTQAIEPPQDVKEVALPAPVKGQSKVPQNPNYDPAKDPMKPGDDRVKAARELLHKGDLDAAERKCREAIKIFRGSYAADWPKELLGDIQLAKGQYEEALESYGVARSHSANPGLSLNVAFCFIRLGDYKNAKKSYSDRYLLRNTGVNKEDLPGIDDVRALEASILLARGAEARSTGDYKEAVANFEPALKLAPRNGMLAYVQARTLMDLKRYDEALPMFTRAVRFGNPAQVKSAKSTMIQMWPRDKADAAIRDAAKIP